MTRRSPMFTVVVPTMDRDALIRPTLESFQKQSFGDFELRVADDGGSDGTAAIVESLGDERFRYEWAPHQGKGAARNRGAASGTGRYVCFFDSDDWAGPEHLARARDVIAERPDIPAFFQDFEIRDPDGTLLRGGRFPGERVVRDELLRGNCFPPGGVFLRRDVARSVRWCEDPTLITSEDWLLWLRVAARVPIVALPGPTWALIDHGERTSRRWTTDEVRSSLARVLRELATDEAFMGRWGARGVRRVRARMLSHGALRGAIAGDRRAAVGMLTKATLLQPSEMLDRRALAVIKHLVRSMWPSVS